MAVQGFRSVGVDYVLNKSTPEAFCLNIDLTSAEGQELAWKWIRHPSVVLIWTAPPCGTASRAREKPGGPPPLRDGQFPEGFPHLAGKDKLRVDKANIIYAFCAAVSDYTLGAGIGFAIENPTRSLMWQTRWFKALREKWAMTHVDYHACMHGGKIKTPQRLLINWSEFLDLAAECDGAQGHATWVVIEDGQRNCMTAEEAQYPYISVTG